MVHYSTETAFSTFDDSDVVNFITFRSTDKGFYGFTVCHSRLYMTLIETASDLPFCPIFDTSIFAHFGQCGTSSDIERFVVFAGFTFQNGNIQFAVSFFKQVESNTFSVFHDYKYL
ncbi:hypothetical protein EKO81_02750 [Salmonella enterica]|nr:hypothetical protein [Salmonella enterica]